MNRRAIHLFSLLALCFLFTVSRLEPAQQPSLATVAEKSNYTKTSTHAEVLDFCEKLAKQSPLVRLAELGVTPEGRKLPLLILADPPIATPEEAAKSGKMVLFAMGNIHAGEVDGKEALCMLARDLAMAKNRPLLKDFILVFAPNFNADGGDKMGNNRQTQAGPPLVGIRHNAQNFDLNRDFVKLESPECQALIRFFRHWDPALVIDCHTTDGSYHQYTLTYDSPRNPSNPLIRDFGRDVMLPDVSKRLQKSTGYKSFYYGDFNNQKSPTRWTTTEAQPRFGFHYQGFRNRLGILSESYDYAPFRDRVLVSYGFVKTCFEFVADNKDKIAKLLAAADKANTDAPAGATVALRHKSVPLGGKTTVLGLQGGKTIESGAKPVDHQIDVLYKTEPTLTVARPYAYLFPAALAKVVENLQRHGVEVEELREDIELDVEVYKVDKVKVDAKPKQGYGKHNLVSVDATSRKASQKVKAGTIVVRTNQKLGTLAAFLLEPQSEDGLTTWNFFDAVLKEGQDFPVLRLPKKTAMTLGKVKPLAEEQGPKKQLTVEMIDNGTLPNFDGDPVSVVWMEDGEHFLQVKEGVLCKVHAVTGRSVPYTSTDLDTFETQISPIIAWRSGPFQKKGKAGGKGGRELETKSADGKYAVFVRGNNLIVEEVAGKKERALTKDGSASIFNGKVDWVYGEEVYDRKNSKHFWWSSNSNHLAFLRLDDTVVPKATVMDYSKFQPTLETTHYPNVGDPNPLVKFAIATVVPNPATVAKLEGQLDDKYKTAAYLQFMRPLKRTPEELDRLAKIAVELNNQIKALETQLKNLEVQGEVNWVDLSAYAKDDGFIIPRVGWTPDGKTCWFCVMDRCQTWLDFCTVGVEGGKPAKLFRDSTRAWVEYPLTPLWLKDGSVLFSSERTGWQHIYHYAKDGKLIGPVTTGEWDVRSMQRVDEESGYLYFSGTKENQIASNAYRVKLDGTGMERMTKGKGEHEVQFNPRGDLFIDTYWDIDAPAQVRLHRADGTLVRVLDTNPVYIREAFQMGGYQRLQIATRDGFLIEASVQKPAKFDATKKYPVWVQTYGGPNMPMLKGGGGGMGGKGGKGGGDQAIANLGYIVMHVDPRSSSKKGAVSAWTCYKQLGFQELADLEDAVKWITANPWADAKRVGISGMSYGGYMAGFALINSKMFAAGIAGAPPTDWRNYDSIYTERYMLTPKENAKGYDKTSLVKNAKNISGRLLLVHGVRDDNVHVQNTLQLAQALQGANKAFDLMLYPPSRHGGFSAAHYTQLQRDFMKMHLRPEQ